MDATILYNGLMDEIQADQQALDDKKKLARLLRERIERSEQAAAATAAAFSAMTSPATAPAAPVAAPQVSEASQPTLVELVERALPDLGYREFVVGDVADAMRARGIQLSGDKPNSKITTVLTRLHTTGVLERTFKGGGNVPNRFRRVQQP